MLAATLRWNIRDGSFEDLEKSLLYTFAGDVASDRRVLVLATDLVDLVDVDDAALSAGDVTFGRLEQLEDDIFDIFADVTGLSKGGGVNDGKGHIEHLRQRVGEQGFA